MTRSNASARKAGSAFERLIADCLAKHVDDRIDRRVKTGSADKGDLGGIRDQYDRRLVAECKDVARTDLSGWVKEAEAERANDQAAAAFVIHKRRGKSDPLDQYVTTTVRDLIVLLGMERPA